MPLLMAAAMRSLFIAGLLLASALAIAPHASAEPGYECADGNLTEKVVDEGYLQVNLRRDCSLEAVFFEGLICVGGWGGVIEKDIDKHTLRVYYCTGGFGGPGGPIDVSDFVALDAGATGCAPKTVEVNDVASGTTHRVEIFHNCRSHITLNEGVTCVGPWTATDEYEFGVTHITNHRCAMPGGDPTLTTTDAAYPCSDAVRYYPGITVYSHADCSQRVDIKFYDCVWNCGWATVVNTDLLTVRYYTQSTGQTMATGVDIPPGPMAPCWKLEQQHSLGATNVRVTDGCQVIIEVRLYECIWGGYWDEKTYGPVTVRQYKCGPPTQTSGAEMVPPPGPNCPAVNEPAPLTPFVDVRSKPYICEYEVVLMQTAVCTAPLHGDTVVRQGNFVVRWDGCGIPDEWKDPTDATARLLPSSADAAPQCNGIWWHHSQHTVPVVGAVVTLDTNLQPQCTTARVQQGAIDCTFSDSVKPDCEESVIEPWQCLGGASGHKDYATPVGLTLRVNMCSAPPSNGPPIQ